MIHINRTEARPPFPPCAQRQKKGSDQGRGTERPILHNPEERKPTQRRGRPERRTEAPTWHSGGGARREHEQKTESASRRTVPECQGLELRVSWFTTSYFCPCVAHLISSSEGVTKHPPPPPLCLPAPYQLANPTCHICHLSEKK